MPKKPARIASPLAATLPEVSQAVATRGRGRPRAAIPSLYRHKQTNQAYVVVNGKTKTFGQYGAPDTTQAYLAFCGELANGTTAIDAATPSVVVARLETVTVADLGRKYLKHCRETFFKRETNTSHVARVQRVFRQLDQCSLSSIVISAFGPKSLKTFQVALASALRMRRVRDAAGNDTGKVEPELDARGNKLPAYSRSTINTYTGIIVAAFKWATSEELCPVTVYQALAAAGTIHKDRSPVQGVRLREKGSVQPVAAKIVEATLKHTHPILSALVRVQALGAMRPIEARLMRIEELEPVIDTKTKQTIGYVYHVSEDACKTSHLGVARTVFLGPKAVAILAPLIEGRELGSYVFDAMQARATARKPKGRHRRQGDKSRPYTLRSYSKAIERACQDAGVEPWVPRQIRHSAATDIADSQDLDTARLMLGHTKIETTMIYAKTAQRKALAFALAHG
jgi:integrase